jgi:peptidyl-prolyl cis-trans isomerase C
MKPGEYSKKPVKSEFGYHIIQLEELRKRPPAEFEQARPFLEAQLRQQILNEIVQKWRDDAKIERFDINGEPIEPAAGDEEAKDAPAE